MEEVRNTVTNPRIAGDWAENQIQNLSCRKKECKSLNSNV
jgi:hypothetical protein